MTIIINSSHPAGITDVPGFAAAAASADVRGQGHRDRLDMALIRNLGPQFTAAAVFTRNDIQAAPVRLGRAALERSGGHLQAILINSGNANACTGPEGDQDNEALVDAVAAQLQQTRDEILISSTGRIGRRLPLERMVYSIPDLVAGLEPSPGNGTAAARAIMTSDTRPKCVTVTCDIQSTIITVSGMAKGAGMIQPDMATMLAYFATDASLSPVLAQQLLHEATNRTFNTISVDGDMSTNDTVVLMANGRSGIVIDDCGAAEVSIFQTALHAACEAMARAIVGDGEKISHVVELIIEGGSTGAEAETVARAIGNSLLVKSSWYGCDPNWGRLLDAAGYARVGLDENQLELYYEDCPVFLHGREQAQHLATWREIVKRREFRILLNLNRGSARFRMLTTDLTEDYVNFNKSE